MSDNKYHLMFTSRHSTYDIFNSSELEMRFTPYISEISIALCFYTSRIRIEVFRLVLPLRDATAKRTVLVMTRISHGLSHEGAINSRTSDLRGNSRNCGVSPADLVDIRGL